MFGLFGLHSLGNITLHLTCMIVSFILSDLSINTWYKSLRTRYGKLKMKKSGDGAAELTDRENWLLQKFTFLDGHIHRVKTRPLVSVSALLHLVCQCILYFSAIDIVPLVVKSTKYYFATSEIFVFTV